MGRKRDEKRSAGTFGGGDYLAGAIERLAAAYTLLKEGHFADTIYLAGRAVEGMLRAVIWHRDPEIRRGLKTLETGHDLRELLSVVRNLGLLDPQADDRAFTAAVERVGRLWFNNLRFALSRFVRARWLLLGEIRRGRTFKQAAEAFHWDCSAIIKRGEALCQKSSSRRS